MTLKIHYVTTEELAKTSLQPTDCFVFLNVEKNAIEYTLDKVPFKPFGLALYMNTVFPGEENSDTACTLLDIETYLDFLECLDSYKRIFFVDLDFNRSLSFALGLAVYLKAEKSVEDALYSQAKSLPSSQPNALWAVMCIDKSLELGTKLIEAYNDYFVTAVAVDSNGNIAEGSF
jgi:hypothetical protein